MIEALSVFGAMLPGILLLLLLRKRVARLLRNVFLLLLVSVLVGCSTTSNKIDKAPCACEFTPFEANGVEGVDHA